ncbi:MAG TPA: TlpA disulfide reductase family protein [Pyrinomonadaceae bacterium]|nr:TlpA disulfide reductase family protein [Pyrinomonadaceae bacterium]
MSSLIQTFRSSRWSIGLNLATFSHGLLLLLIVGLCVANGLLVRQNRSLKAAIAHQQPEFLMPGQQVPSFTANTLSGQRQVVNFADHPKTVFLVFASQCPVCERTLPYWKAIKEACDRQQYQVYGVGLDGRADTRDLLTANGLNIEVFGNPSAEFKKLYKLNLTPLTIVIDNQRKVEKVWAGAFNENTKAEMETYFGISRAAAR